ncbi:MAG: GGDEF domain-containing phosphodiesterase, partial [Anaerolineales bacterium]
ILKRADLAMYQAKAAGRNTLRFFDPEMQAAVTARATLETDLRQGLQQKEFLLYYQPQVDEQGRMMGAEALARWQHPRRGLMLPVDFIPLAEETGLILPLGHWVLETACAQLVAWAAQPEMACLTLAVNVSARQFHRSDFVGQVLEVLDQTGANPQKLKLELTESLLLEDVEDVIAKMTALKAKGVSFSLDDFGIGYSSLSYLKRLPLDQLKIDQSFVRDILTDSDDAAIACTIVALAQSMGLEVIAEGVETIEQRDFLARHSCHAFQGYLFGKPVPVEQFRLCAMSGK